MENNSKRYFSLERSEKGSCRGEKEGGQNSTQDGCQNKKEQIHQQNPQPPDPWLLAVDQGDFLLDIQIIAGEKHDSHGGQPEENTVEKRFGGSGVFDGQAGAHTEQEQLAQRGKQPAKRNVATETRGQKSVPVRGVFFGRFFGWFFAAKRIQGSQQIFHALIPEGRG